MNTSRGTFCESQQEDEEEEVEEKKKSGGSGGIPKISHMRMHFSFFISLVPIAPSVCSPSACVATQ